MQKKSGRGNAYNNMEREHVLYERHLADLREA